MYFNCGNYPEVDNVMCVSLFFCSDFCVAISYNYLPFKPLNARKFYSLYIWFSFYKIEKGPSIKTEIGCPLNRDNLNNLLNFMEILFQPVQFNS